MQAYEHCSLLQLNKVITSNEKLFKNLSNIFGLIIERIQTVFIWAECYGLTAKGSHNPPKLTPRCAPSRPNNIFYGAYIRLNNIHTPSSFFLNAAPKLFIL